jgi:hypothetical protein
MPADLHEMLHASDTHDALTGIEHRDLPTLEPRTHALRPMVDAILAPLTTTLEDGEYVLLKHRIISALIEVRHVASSHACVTAWNRAAELLK